MSYPKLSEMIYSERTEVRCRDVWLAEAVVLEKTVQQLTKKLETAERDATGWRARAYAAMGEANPDADSPLPEDDAIKAAHPTRSGRHDLYAEAMRLVGAKHTKAALVELVNWLLVDAGKQQEDAYANGYATANETAAQILDEQVGGELPDQIRALVPKS